MKEIYIPLSGAVAREKQMAMVTNNLANINSSGFKKDSAIFRVRPPETRLERMDLSADTRLNLPDSRQRLEGNRNYTAIAESYVDFAPGDLRPTGSPFDLALQEGNPDTDARSFFVVMTPEGDRYTRKGNFSVNSQGLLVTSEGFPLKGMDGQPLRIGQQPFEPIVVSTEGNIVVQQREVGQLQRVMVDSPQLLEKMGNGFFSDRGGLVPVREATPQDGPLVRQRFLEMSNVNVVDELVRMIDSQRAFSSYQRTIQAMDDASGQVTNWAMER
jgi:flagellar basal-body rod protein FlgG